MAEENIKSFVDEEGISAYHAENMKKIKSSINSHNSSSTAHEDMRAEIADLNEIAHTHTNLAELEKITAAFTTELKDKLSNIEEGATSNIIKIVRWS